MLGYLTKGLVNSCVVLLMVSAGFVSAQNQTVSAVVSLTEILPGETTSLSITYNVSASSTDGLLTSGLGLRLHYDSTSVYCDESVISDLLADSSIGMQLMNDTDDKDTDASTDKYLNTAWANINGAWPSTASLPATLYTLNCTALSGFTGTTLKFSTSSTASGYDFIASDIVLTERLLPTDTTAPVITLLGDAQVTVDLDGTYSDSGAVADTGETIILSGFVDTSTIGTYTLTYSATDDAGNQADAVTRTVIVENTDTGGGTDGGTDLTLDTDGDGIPDVLENETGRNPLMTDYMVAAGDKFSCALDNSGVVCWGDAANNKLDVPTLTNPTYVAVGFDHACAIDDTGVVCWGNEQMQKTNPPVLSNPTVLELGRLHSCAVDDSGVVCWGSNGRNRSTPPSLSNPIDLSVGHDHACAIDDTGVVCWGRLSNKRGQVPAGLENPTQVAAGWNHGCVLDDSGVSCWGSTGKTGTNTPPTLSNPTVVESGSTFSCAIDDTGVVCWGNNYAKQLSRIPVLSNPTQLSLGTDHACAVDATGVVCWGSTGRGKSSPPVDMSIVTDNDSDGIEDWEEDILGTNKYLADTDGDGVEDSIDEMPLDGTESLDSDRDGTGNNADADDDNDGIPDALEIETGRDPLVVDYATGVGAKFSCGMDENGVHCWGDSADGKTSVPVLSNPTQLAVGFEHACAIDDTGVVCWGKDNAGNTVAPALSNPVVVSAGHYHSCAIDDTGIVCWGDTSHKLMTRMPEFSYPTEVSVGDEHACAIDSSGVVCWGKKSNKRGQVPSGLVNPRHLSAGFLHSCVIDDNGVSCWGSRASTGTITPPTLSNPTSVVAGKTFSCAIDDNGVTCWGVNGRKQKIVPTLYSPVQLDLGNDHACAVDATGVVCWGGNSLGKRDVPTNLEFILDNDNDGVEDKDDPAPLNPDEYLDTDSDGLANNVDPDDDGDGVADISDAFPLDSAEYLDSDSDGIGNVADLDDDNDGVEDLLDAFPFDSTETVDSNGDGFGDNAYPPNPTNPNATSFTLSAPGASSVSMQASVYNWEIGRADSFATDNGDGTWTLIVDPSWTSQVDYKWRVDDIQEDFSSDYRAGECSSVYFAGYADTWFNRIWNPDRGVVTDDIAGTCIADDITGGGTGSSQLTMTVRADSASSVRITGPLWGWDVAAGPVATNNNDGTWSVILDPMPAADMEYLWVIDGIQENLISNAANAECSNEINSGAMVTDYFSFTNRQWIVGSGEISGTVANACSDSIIVDPQPEPTVLANVLSNGIVDNGWDVGLAAFDSGQDYASCYNDDGAGCPNVSWSLVSDSERGDVLQVSHADTGIYVGMYFASSAGRDFTAAANGNLVFDIKSVAGDSNFVVKVDCEFPCASNNIDLGSQGSAGWQTVSIPVSTLTSNGLDLTKVSTGLVIWPVAAANTVYQLDNIRWEVPEGSSEPQVDYTPTSYSGYSLAWSDEFNGSSVNKSDWTFETGRGSNGWGNQESQFYREENTTVANGLLTIEAKEENFNGAEYTSSRLITRGKQSFKYGRIDVRAKLPQGQGLWPAIWMLGERFDTVGWPASGEIDIMEMIGGDGREDTIHGTIHYADNNGSHQYVGDSVGLVSCQAIGCANTFADAFHTFSIEWDSQSIKWLVDGVEFASQQITSSDRTEFHEEFFFIMNVAVGGQWPGYPDNSTNFPQQMQVDYVRVYQPTLSQFSFLQSDNPGLSSDINLSLENGVLSGRAAIGDSVDNLIASFQQAGESISIDGIDQFDGVTSNDFSNPLNYTIVGNDGLETTIAVDLAEFTGLPIVNINTLGGVGIDSKDDYVLGTVSVDGGRGFTDFPELAIEIRGRGNSTWGHPKKPYQMKFAGKEEFLDMPKDKKWIFLAEYSDKTLLRNRMAFEMGYISNLDWTPESTFAEVFINDQYNGTYNIVQKVEETNRRVALGDTGYLLEIDQIFRLDPDDVYFETGTFLLNIKEPSLVKDDLQYVYIRDLINDFENALFGNNFMDPTTGYAAFIDLPSFIDWYLISEITKNVDSVSFSSIYLNVMPNEKIKMGPLWDFDLSFGNVDYADSRYAEGFWIKNNPWYSRLFQDPAFVALVQDRFAYFRDNQATILEKIDTYATQLKWAQQENNDKWQTIGSYVWPNPVVYDTYQEEVDHMKDWYVQRMNWLDGALGDL